MICEHRWDKLVEQVSPKKHDRGFYIRSVSVCRDCGRTSKTGMVRWGKKSGWPIVGLGCVILTRTGAST